MVRAEDVIRRIELYYEGGALEYEADGSEALATAYTVGDPILALGQPVS